jgi:hypothetical protein
MFIAVSIRVSPEHARGRDRDVQGVGAEPLLGDLERGAVRVLGS